MTIATKKHNKSSRSTGSAVLYWLVGFLLISTMFSVWFVCGLFAKYTTSAPSGDLAHVAGTGVNKLEVKEHKAELKKGDNANNYLKDDLLYELLEGVKNEVTKNEYKKVLPGVDIPKDPFVRLELVNAEVDYIMYLKVVESKYWPEYVLDPETKTTARSVTYEIDDTLWEKVSEDGVIDGYDDNENPFYYYKFIGNINNNEEYKGYFDAGKDYYLTEASVPDYSPPKNNEENKENQDNNDVQDSEGPKKESVIHILKDNKLTVSEHYVGFKVDNNGNFLLDDNGKKIPQKFSLTFEVYLVQVD